MTAGLITIAWTAAEAVLLGPESRLVRQPLTSEEDAPALILEIWRTEFPEILAAKLLAGDDPMVAAGIPRLIEIAREAGLRLEAAAPAAGAGPRRKRFSMPRVQINPRAVFLGAIVAAAILIAGWRWSQAREHARVGRLTAAERASELRQAQSAAAGRRSQAVIEQTEALLAAVQIPRQFQSDLLAALEANVPPSIVIDAIEIVGARCRVQGHTVPGAPGADTAPEALRRALFTPASVWDVGNTLAQGSAFTWVATAIPAKKDPAAPLPSLEDATAARDRLSTAIEIRSLLNELAPTWKIESKDTASTQGIERHRYALSLILSSPASWTNTLQLVRRLNTVPGLSIEFLTLASTPAENGSLERATLEVTARSLVSSIQISRP